ncbi:MAG: hypothetical protein WDW38_003623 [Sanguina aurantia]
MTTIENALALVQFQEGQPRPEIPHVDVEKKEQVAVHKRILDPSALYMNLIQASPDACPACHTGSCIPACLVCPDTLSSQAAIPSSHV